MKLDSGDHLVLGFVVGLGLLGAYALGLWLRSLSRHNRPKGRE